MSDAITEKSSPAIANTVLKNKTRLNCSKFSIILLRLQDRTDINLFSFQHLRDACNVECRTSDLIFGVLMPLSAIFQLYHGDQF